MCFFSFLSLSTSRVSTISIREGEDPYVIKVRGSRTLTTLNGMIEWTNEKVFYMITLLMHPLGAMMIEFFYAKPLKSSCISSRP